VLGGLAGMSTVAGSILALSDTVILPSGGLLLGLMLVAGLIGRSPVRVRRLPCRALAARAKRPLLGGPGKTTNIT